MILFMVYIFLIRNIKKMLKGMIEVRFFGIIFFNWVILFWIGGRKMVDIGVFNFFRYVGK